MHTVRLSSAGSYKCLNRKKRCKQIQLRKVKLKIEKVSYKEEITFQGEQTTFRFLKKDHKGRRIVILIEACTSDLVLVKNLLEVIQLENMIKLIWIVKINYQLRS